MGETAPLTSARCIQLASFTHTSPTGMEPDRAARTAGGGRGLFCAAHTAASSRRILPAFVWIVALVSGSRSRTYPPNEGEWGARGGRGVVVGDATPAEGGTACGPRTPQDGSACWFSSTLDCFLSFLYLFCRQEVMPPRRTPPSHLSFSLSFLLWWVFWFVDESA